MVESFAPTSTLSLCSTFVETITSSPTLLPTPALFAPTTAEPLRNSTAWRAVTRAKRDAATMRCRRCCFTLSTSFVETRALNDQSSASETRSAPNRRQLLRHSTRIASWRLWLSVLCHVLQTSNKLWQLLNVNYVYLLILNHHWDESKKNYTFFKQQ